MTATPYEPPVPSARAEFATVQAVNGGLVDLDFGGEEPVTGVACYGALPQVGARVLVLLQGSGATVLTAGTGSMPTGSLMPFAGGMGVFPDGWLLANGQAVSRTDYADLFAVIGTAYGAGDGSSTFNVPNLLGRAPVGYDGSQAEFNALGKTGGAKTHTLTVNEMPSHTHAFQHPNTTAAANYAGSGGLQGTQTTVRAGIANTGGGAAHNNLQPYIALHYLIKA